LYGLDLADGWRGRLQERMLEDTDSEMLYQNAMDGFEGDDEPNMQLGLAPMGLKEWFQPFNDSFIPASCFNHPCLATSQCFWKADKCERRRGNSGCRTGRAGSGR